MLTNMDIVNFFNKLEFAGLKPPCYAQEFKEGMLRDFAGRYAHKLSSEELHIAADLLQTSDEWPSYKQIEETLRAIRMTTEEDVVCEAKDAFPDGSTWTDYARDFGQRHFPNMSVEALEKNQETVINETIESLQEIAAHNTAAVQDMMALTDEYLNELFATQENPELVKGIATGYVTLDKLLHGLKPGSLNLLAARPSMGKTALALNIALNAARNEGREKKKVLFISLEMTEKELINRCASSLAGLDCSKIQDPQLLSEGETSAAAYAVYKLMNLGVVIHRESEFTLNKLRQLVQKLKRTEKPDFIVIDYLQLMVTDHRDDSYTKVTKISNGLKALALELDIPILALSQLNRAVEGRAVKKPLLSDLRESGSLEQDADVVMLLSRKDYYEKSDCEEPGVAELELAKARNGALGRVKLFFDRSSCNFMELG